MVKGVIAAAVTLTCGAVLMVPAVGARMADDWKTALAARSQALNQRYGLGDRVLREPGAASSAWERALTVRSAALNSKYRLGQYALVSAGNG